jgi:hypothetical protein
VDHGTGSELRQPLGYAMVGGLLVSQVLTLFTTPVVYLYLDRVSQWLSPTRHDRGDEGVAEDVGETMDRSKSRVLAAE